MLNTKKLLTVAKVFSITWKHLKLAYHPSSNIDLLKKSWSREIVLLFNLKINILGNPVATEGPYLLIGNHISYLDIPVLLFSKPDISFVSKSEVKSWPIIGKAAVLGRTVFVERNNKKSRSQAKVQIADNLIQNKNKVVIFPSGTTAIKTSALWKRGAFEIAETNNIRLQPFRIHYKPLRAAAYVGADNFLVHMYKLLRFDEIFVTIEFHDPVSITNSAEDCKFWKHWCEQ